MPLLIASHINFMVSLSCEEIIVTGLATLANRWEKDGFIWAHTIALCYEEPLFFASL